jgi:DNA-binding NarL/FixJ family response regulator
MSYAILIVDDSKLARMAVNKVLNGLYPDWTRLEAGNADEAMALFKQSAPDIAVLDFNMPNRDGLDLATELRQLNPGMPIAVVSANRQQEIVSRASAIDAVFLPKPLNAEDLAHFLEVAVQLIERARR